jgi:hypothetical protein
MSWSLCPILKVTLIYQLDFWIARCLYFQKSKCWRFRFAIDSPGIFRAGTLHLVVLAGLLLKVDTCLLPSLSRFALLYHRLLFSGFLQNKILTAVGGSPFGVVRNSKVLFPEFIALWKVYLSGFKKVFHINRHPVQAWKFYKYLLSPHSYHH